MEANEAQTVLSEHTRHQFTVVFADTTLTSQGRIGLWPRVAVSSPHLTPLLNTLSHTFSVINIV